MNTTILKVNGARRNKKAQGTATETTMTVLDRTAPEGGYTVARKIRRRMTCKLGSGRVTPADVTEKTVEYLCRRSRPATSRVLRDGPPFPSCQLR